MDRRKRKQQQTKFVAGLLVAIWILIVLGALVGVALSARAESNETTSPSPAEAQAFPWLWVALAVACLITGLFLGSYLQEWYVRRWQARRAAEAAQAYADLKPEEKIRYALSRIYQFIEQVDPKKLLTVQVFETEKWRVILSSQSLLVFARKSDLQEWTIDSHDDQSAIMSIRLQRVNVNPILNEQFKEVLHNAGEVLVPDRSP